MQLGVKCTRTVVSQEDSRLRALQGTFHFFFFTLCFERFMWYGTFVCQGMPEKQELKRISVYVYRIVSRKILFIFFLFLIFCIRQRHAEPVSRREKRW